MKRLLLATAAVTALATALPASAQFRKPEDAVKYRKAAFTVMSNHFARLGAMTKGDIPFDGAAATANADIVAMLAHLPFQGFVEGTAGNGDKGTARPGIWSERAKFDEAARTMQSETAKLATAARSNNLETLKTAFGAASKTCMSCHDSYRVK